MYLDVQTLEIGVCAKRLADTRPVVRAKVRFGPDQHARGSVLSPRDCFT
jgi:hypothetical protein